MRYLLLLSLAFLMGCGPLGAPIKLEPKEFFSLWTAPEQGVKVDLRPAVFGVSTPITFRLVGGPQCKCQIMLQGNEVKGLYVVHGCAYIGGGSGDPGCLSLNESGQYAKTARQLMFCDVMENCATYR